MDIPVHHPVRDRIHRQQGVDRQRKRLRRRRLQVGELARHQGARHEVADTLRHAHEGLMLGQLQENEAQIRHPGAQAVPVAALERRTRQHGTLAASRRSRQLQGQKIQPAGPVLIGERDAAAHFVHVGLRMKHVALDQASAQSGHDGLRDTGLAAARDTHHHQG